MKEANLLPNYIQPIHRNDEGLVNTFSGKLLKYDELDSSMICLEDIAKGLSNICRFGGQIRDFYSVAQHTLLVWYISPDDLKRAALLHDAAEAYIGDVVKPFKNLLGKTYTYYETIFERVIFSKYGVDIAQLKDIKSYDMEALDIENNYFRFGKLDLIQKQYEINELIPFKTPFDQLTAVLRSEFLQAEINYKQNI